MVDEALQAVIPGRVFDPADNGVNVAAVALAIGATLALRAASRLRQRP